MTSKSDIPQNPGKYSRAQGYSLPIFASGFVLVKIFDPDGDVICTVAETDEHYSNSDALVSHLNKGE